MMCKFYIIQICYLATIFISQSTLSKRWPSDKLIMFVITKFAHHGVINPVIDLSLHSQLFRVYCYCIDLDHILVLISHYKVIIGHYDVCCLFACDCK